MPTHSLSITPPHQANVNKNEEQSEWRLDALAAKMVQYCYLLEGLTGEQQ